MVLTTISAVLFLVVFLADLFGLHTNPYIGILFFLLIPAILVVGLLLIPLGAWLERRRRAAGKAPSAVSWPRVDLNDPTQRATAIAVFALTLANIVIVSLAAYRGVEYLDSPQFCGQVPRTRAAKRIDPIVAFGEIIRVMPKTNVFADTFAARRAILEPHAKRLTVTVDDPWHYQLASPTMTDRIGRPLCCASVRVNKKYVSYHLMPVYGNKALRDSLSPSLQLHHRRARAAERTRGGHKEGHRGFQESQASLGVTVPPTGHDGSAPVIFSTCLPVGPFASIGRVSGASDEIFPRPRK